MSRFLNEKYQQLEAYVPGEQPRDMRYIKLNTNESPYPPSPAVLRALADAEQTRLNLYPDPTGQALREGLARLCGVGAENILISNGSDEALSFAFMAYGGDGVSFPDISYGFYKVYAQLYGWSYTEVALKDDLTIDPADYIEREGMVVIANPNAPTGIALSRDELEPVIASNPNRIVLIDEAYVDFGGESCCPLIQKYDNLLVVQTYSKFRSLAGGRLGFAVGCKTLIDDLNRLRFSINPYNVNSLTMAAGAAALSDAGYYDKNRDEVVSVREHVKSHLQAMGFTVTNSKTNFLFAATQRVEGEILYSELKKRGILVRHFSSPRITNYIRITIGTRQQMDILLAALREIIE